MPGALAPNALVRTAVRVAGLGYAMPGTVLALGLLIPLAAFDNRIDALLRSSFGVSSGLLLSGSLFVIVLAYAIRFLAVSPVGHGGGPSSGCRPTSTPQHARSAKRRSRRCGGCICRC